MVFKKGMVATKGFTGRKHTQYTRWMMSESHRITHQKKRERKR